MHGSAERRRCELGARRPLTRSCGRRRPRRHGACRTLARQLDAATATPRCKELRVRCTARTRRWPRRLRARVAARGRAESPEHRDRARLLRARRDAVHRERWAYVAAWIASAPAGSARALTPAQVGGRDSRRRARHWRRRRARCPRARRTCGTGAPSRPAEPPTGHRRRPRETRSTRLLDRRRRWRTAPASSDRQRDRRSIPPSSEEARATSARRRRPRRPTADPAGDGARRRPATVSMPTGAIAYELVPGRRARVGNREPIAHGPARAASRMTGAVPLAERAPGRARADRPPGSTGCCAKAALTDRPAVRGTAARRTTLEEHLLDRARRPRRRHRQRAARGRARPDAPGHARPIDPGPPPGAGHTTTRLRPPRPSRRPRPTRRPARPRQPEAARRPSGDARPPGLPTRAARDAGRRPPPNPARDRGTRHVSRPTDPTTLPRPPTHRRVAPGRAVVAAPPCVLAGRNRRLAARGAPAVAVALGERSHGVAARAEGRQSGLARVRRARPRRDAHRGAPLLATAGSRRRASTRSSYDAVHGLVQAGGSVAPPMSRRATTADGCRTRVVHAIAIGRASADCASSTGPSVVVERGRSADRRRRVRRAAARCSTSAQAIGCRATYSARTSKRRPDRVTATPSRPSA